MTRSTRIASTSLRACLLGTALLGALACTAQDADAVNPPPATGTATSEILVAAGTKIVVPKGLSYLTNGFVVVSTPSSDPVTGGQQGKDCPFDGAKQTTTSDTACGYDINQNWVCCNASCDYTCRINPDSHRQYWNTDSCSVIQSTCAVRSGGPGGGGFDVFEIQSAG